MITIFSKGVVFIQVKYQIFLKLNPINTFFEDVVELALIFHRVYDYLVKS